MLQSMLGDVEGAFKSFFVQITSALGFVGILAVVLAVEAFLVFLFVLKTFYSYEIRLKRSLYKLNSWLFKNKKIDQSNIKEFNELVKKGPKRLTYNWQQFILFREKEPTYYLSMENLIEKPLKTSSWDNNIKNLNLATIIWAGISLILGIACQAVNSAPTVTFTALVASIALPVFVVIIGIVAQIFLKGKKISNLDDIYNNYHIFARFISNACVDLPSYIDYDLLFSSKEIAKGNPQLREYYESRARKAKEEFENAKKSDVEYIEYNFGDAGVDGSLVLERAMKETEAFINKKTSTLAKISHAEAEKEALRRNYENVQKDLQRKIQASKENINKFIQQQEATTNRMEVGFIRKQQEQEIAKQEALQNEYDQEETRFALSIEELNQEIDKLRAQLDESKETVQKAMVAEYQSFYEKVMKSAYNQMEKKVEEEKETLKKQRDNNEKELIVVQTQIKRLVDENNTLRSRLGDEMEDQSVNDGVYDENGNYVYKDGSYHDPNGLFHDIDGKVYDMNGTLIDEPKTETQIEEEKRLSDIEAFGSFIDLNQQQEKPKQSEPALEEKKEEPEPAMVVEEYKPEEETKVEETKKEVVEPQEPVKPVVEEVKAIEEKPKGKRGRPRKEPTEKVAPQEPKKRGRPKKEATEPKEKKPVGRPRKTTTISTPKAKTPVQNDTSKDEDRIASLEKISERISEEERKLNKMKMLINSEINDAIEESNNQELNKERDKIINEIENLKTQAQQVKEGSNPEELANINARLESLIKEISAINNK